MADVTPMRIGAESVLTDDVSEVRSPFDGRVVGRVPVGTEEHLDTAVAAALARHREGALPAYQRAEILDRAAVLLTERKEEFARMHLRRGGQADQDGPGRGRAGGRHLPLLGRRGPHAGRRDGADRRQLGRRRQARRSCSGCRSG